MGEIILPEHIQRFYEDIKQRLEDALHKEFYNKQIKSNTKDEIISWCSSFLKKVVYNQGGTEFSQLKLDVEFTPYDNPDGIDKIANIKFGNLFTYLVSMGHYRPYELIKDLEEYTIEGVGSFSVNERGAFFRPFQAVQSIVLDFILTKNGETIFNNDKESKDDTINS